MTDSELSIAKEEKWHSLQQRLNKLEEKLLLLLEQHQQTRSTDIEDITVNLSAQFSKISQMMENLTAQLDNIELIRQEVQQESTRLQQHADTSIEKIEQVYKSREEEISSLYKKQQFSLANSSVLQQKIIEENLGDSISHWLKNRKQGIAESIAMNELELLHTVMQNKEEIIQKLSLSPRQQEILKSLSKQDSQSPSAIDEFENND